MELIVTGIQRMAEHYEAECLAQAAPHPALASVREAIRDYRERRKRDHEKNKALAWEIEKQQQRRRRAKRKLLSPDPKELIEQEFEERLGKLQRAVSARRRDKRLEQVRGREQHYSLVWKAKALATLKFGSKPSAARIAEEGKSLLGDPSFNRHKASGALKVIASLEKPGEPWALH